MITKNFQTFGIEEKIINKISKNNNKIDILEIGGYNGSSSSWLVDNLNSENEDSLVTNVEPSNENSEKIEVIPFKKYELLIEDEKKVLYPKDIKLYNDKSICNLPIILKDKKYYDIIFINGSYLLQDIYEDIEMCWELLKVNGYLFIDEYKNHNSINEIFQSFFKNKYEIISNGTKIIVKKLS